VISGVEFSKEIRKMQATVQEKQDTPASAASTHSRPGAEPAIVSQPGERYSPYLAARLEWDDRHGDAHARAQKSERIALICAGVALVLAAALAVMALRPPKMIVIAVNSKGLYLGSGESDKPVLVTADMKRSALSEWVTNLRSVTSDGISQRWAIEKVYSMISSGSSAQAVVSDFYRGEPPQTRAQSQTVHVEVNTVLPISEKTYEVEWLEITRDLQGKVLLEQRWKGAFTFVVSSGPRNDERSSRLNPMGLYITQASWSKVL
jgi:type IV secretion system protein VirB5